MVGSTIHLKELENTTKYDTSGLEEVFISRFVQDVVNGFESEQVLELSGHELLTFEYDGTKTRSSSEKGYRCVNNVVKLFRKNNTLLHI